MKLSDTDIGRLIRSKRQERFWTQQLLADAAQLSLRTVQRAEMGEGCSKETILAIMAVLDMDQNELQAPDQERYTFVHQWINRIMESLKSLVRYGGVGYLVALAVVVGAIALSFQGLSGASPPADLNAFQESYGGYLKVLTITAVCLGVWMAVLASGIGIAYRALWKGLAALAVAGIVTMMAYALLPSILYPNDKYSPAMLLLVMSAVPIALCWGMVTLVLRRALNLRAGSD